MKFTNLTKKHVTNHYSTFSHMKASVVERFNRTLRNLMWIEFRLIEKYNNMVKYFTGIMKKYNGRKHWTIWIKLANKKEKQHLNTVYGNMKIPFPAKYEVGNHVWISKAKSVFAKSLRPTGQQRVFYYYQGANYKSSIN